MPNLPFQFNSPEEALTALRARLSCVSTEQISLAHASSRILAQPLHTDRPSPALDVSVMDGFALKFSDLPGPLPISGDALIGTPPITLAPNTAARIVTGAPIPHNADCVVRIEDASISGDHVSFPPNIASTLPPSRSIRKQGENAPQGAEVIPAGSRITPAVASALASCGIHSPTVFRKLRIGILSTGDEVLPASATPCPWQLRDGNSAALESLFQSLSFIESVERKHAPDDQRHILASASELLSRCDALFLSGGVSMGHRDLVPAALTQLGAQTIFHKVPQRPGKPILAAIAPRQQLILGLPGNPVSVLVTSHRFGLPALEHIAGLRTPRHAPSITIANPDNQTIPLWWHRIVKLTPDGHAELIDNKGSGDLIASARSDGFLEIPPNAAHPGPYSFHPWHI